MARYYEVIDVKEDVAVDFLILEKGQDPECLEMLMEPKGAYKLRQVTKEAGELTKKMKWWYRFYREEFFPGEYIGTIGVDSGMLVITDPCYVKEEIDPKCEEVFKLIDNEGNSAQILNGFSLALKTGFGDGMYEVTAKRDEEGRIVKVEIDLSN